MRAKCFDQFCSHLKENNYVSQLTNPQKLYEKSTKNECIFAKKKKKKNGKISIRKLKK